MAKAKKKHVEKCSPRIAIKKEIEKKGLRPVCISVISIYYWVISLIGLMVGIIILIGGGGAVGLIPGLGKAVGGIMMAFSLFLILYCTFIAVIAYYLWKLKNWARIVILIITGAAAILNLAGIYFVAQTGDVMSITAMVVALVINSAIVYCVGFNKRTTCYFV